jgi:hypothetical protein
MCLDLFVGLKHGTKIEVKAIYVPWILGLEVRVNRTS